MNECNYNNQHLNKIGPKSKRKLKNCDILKRMGPEKHDDGVT